MPGPFAVIAIVLVLAFGFLGAPLICWALLGAAALFLRCGIDTCFYIYVAVSALFLIKPIRRLLVSSIIMKVMKALNFVPAISQTEREAIEAGTVWIEGELFSGRPSFDRMLKEAYPDLTAEEKAFLDGPVNRLCEILDDWQIWQTRELPQAVWDMIKKEKFLGMIIPKEYGGLGFSALCHSEVVKKISSRSIAAGITVMVPNSLGPAELLVHYGTDAQKKNLLPRLADGREIPCFALTEPGAGSDAGSILANGELFKGDDGKLMMKLNWDKRWISLAAISTVLGLAFRLKDPKNLLGKGEDLGITCALIPSNTPGVELGKRHDPMGVPFYNCPTRGKDVIVSAEDCIVGGTANAGIGWRMLMECLGAGRGISLPSQAAGGVQLSALVASAHASIRKQFGLPIGKFEGIEEPMARIASSAYILEASRKYTCGAIDRGMKPSVVTAITKYNSTEISRKAVNDAMDILGGAGITRGPKNVISSGYIAMPIGITVEGANILTRTLMIFGQGALRAHPFALKEVNAIEKGDLAGFDLAFWGHIGHVVRNTFRSVLLSLTRGRLAGTPSGPAKRHYQKLAWASASFAILADIAMGTLGGSLKFKEKLTGRFADILSWMYLATATLRRFEAEGRKKEDLPYVDYAMAEAFANIQKGFDGIFTNMPALSPLWKCVIGPWSRFNRIGAEPTDDQSHALSAAIQTPGADRDRITDGIFKTKNPSEHVFQLEATFVATKAADETDKKVRKAVHQKKIAKIKGAKQYDEALKGGVITQQEFDNLAKAEKMRWDTIQVDEFTLKQYADRA